MYRALYRKYRPLILNDVVGQKVPITILKNTVLSNCINHAYLFYGPRGCGKTSVAKIFANLVNCSSSKSSEVCGNCEFCNLLPEQKVDIIEIDAASNNGVDEIREINNKVSLSPSLGKYKIYIIDEVHMLSTGAFNALLKTLEEPPAHIIFILATTDPQKIPSTVISRCQRIEFKKINPTEMLEGLKKIVFKENINIENSVIDLIIEFSDGGMRDSIGMLDQLVMYSDNKISVDDFCEVFGIVSVEKINFLSSKIIENDLHSVLVLINQYYAEGYNLIKVVEQLIKLYRKEMMVSLDSDLVNVVTYLNNCLLEMKKNENSKLILELYLIRNIKNNLEFISDVKKISGNNENEDNNKDKTKISEFSIDGFSLKTEIKGKNIEFVNETVDDKESGGQEKISREIKEFCGFESLFLEFQNRRIDNILSKFSKTYMLKLKNEILLLENYKYDENYSSFISYIMDGTLKAASDEGMLFVHETKKLSDLFNESLVQIEDMMFEIFKNKYKLISIDNVLWEEVKNSFNNKKKKYEYISEIDSTVELYKKIFVTSIDDMVDLFGSDIVEYKEGE